MAAKEFAQLQLKNEDDPGLVPEDMARIDKALFEKYRYMLGSAYASHVNVTFEDV